ncbi:hypothetical protein BGI40_08490 [Snodgrassella communis]|jgi:uncharacterized protein (TIGR00369 family)|uniref:Thioesterase domain-containing protein n=2 Tax=Snodgrassella TaxID=1193515 RepID=A0A066TKL9_9NEIS|nr:MULTISPECIES: PaaI family thioesterase [Snodgrassella]KDN13006.1 hypothetical protein SALWKB12_0813 [Snodgrassella communis]KDN14082.1 hypothetical protein SALWKB29_1872 [Snodgrassella communis]PIT11504.1 hypothetical protein BGI29_00590 [Snodgrassella communis]PIT26920.1 hypothetical protein BGI38_07250 [Snodgrassella communis]PIT29660.1 hypothetical protein BGI39_01540 [Snodgrassella communis]
MPAQPELFKALFNHYLNLPHCRWLKIYGDCSTNEPVISINWRDELIENTDSGNIHGGVITTLVDMASACSLAALFQQFETTATLDMRIDYLKQPTAHQSIHVRAHCYKHEGQIAFIRSHCFQEDENQPFALGMATFIHTPLSETEKQALQKYLQQEQAK